MKKISIIDDDSQVDIDIRELTENPKQEFPDELDVTVSINGKEYSGTLTKEKAV